MLGLLFLSFYDSTMFSALHRDNSLSFLTLLNTKLVSNFMRFFAHQFAHHFDQFSPFFTRQYRARGIKNAWVRIPPRTGNILEITHYISISYDVVFDEISQKHGFEPSSASKHSKSTSSKSKKSITRNRMMDFGTI